MCGAAALVATGCGSSATTAVANPDDPPQRGGSITIGMDQEPVCLNASISCGGMAATSRIAEATLDGLLRVVDGEFQPKLALEVPTTANGLVEEIPNGGMTVTVHLQPDAAWSDGHPITCEDVAFRWETQMNENWDVTSTLGWEQITKVDCPDERTVVWHFATRYASYLGVVGTSPLPKHELEGKDFNSYWNSEITVSSGPFIFDTWNRSVDVRLKRNPNYWNKGAEDQPYIDTVRYVFIPDSNTLKVQLRTGEVDLINPPPDSMLAKELATFPRSSFQSEPGVFWEHLAFNTGKEPLSDVRVRQALAYTVDRQKITEVVLRGQVDQLDSTILPANKDYYEPAWGVYEPNPEKVAELLEAAGYTKSGTYYEKDGTPLTVVFKSTSGNVLRQKVAELLQQLMRENGIKMEIEMELAGVFFSQSVPGGTYDIGLWAWSSSTDPSQKGLFHCDMIPSEANEFSGQNYYRYCNTRASKLMDSEEITPDIAKRSAMITEIQQLMAADAPLLPLFQRPETMAYSNRLAGIKVNSLDGMMWNSPEWWVAQ